MTVLWLIIAFLLGGAALLSTVRLLLGPNILDRALSVDMLLASAITGLGAYAAFNRDPTFMPTLLVLSLLGFVGSVSISKFVARRTEGRPENEGHPGNEGRRDSENTDQKEEA